MANNDKYKVLKAKVEAAKTTDEKIDFLSAIVFMIATNDLPCLDKKLKRLFYFGGILLLAVLFSSKASIEFIVGAILRLL